MFKMIIFKVILIPIVYSATKDRNDCPEIKNCICRSANTSIKCKNVMDFPKLPSSIQKVELSNNAITELKRIDFTHNNNITELYLDNNKITTIDEDAFTNLIELQQINLSNNYIGELKKNIFHNNKNLKGAHLQNNPYLTITATSLPTGIEDLDLFSTNSTLPYSQLPNLFGNLKRYHGNLYLDDERTYILPTGIEDLDLFNTNSTLPYSQLPNLFGNLKRYHGNLYLDDERTRILEYKGTINRNSEELHSAPVGTSTSTVKPKHTSTSTATTNVNSSTTTKPEEQSEVVATQEQQEMNLETNCTFYQWVIIIILTVLLAISLARPLFARNASQTAFRPQQEQEQRLVRK